MPIAAGLARLERAHLPGARVVQRNRPQGPATLAARRPHPPGMVGRVPHGARAGFPARERLATRRQGVPLTAGPLPRRRPGLRRHLPHQALRPRPHLGGPLHARTAPGSARERRRREPDVTLVHRLRHVAPAARGRVLRRRRRSSAACSASAATSTTRSRSRACSGSRMAARRCCDIHDVPRRPPPDLDADDGPGPRRPAAARPRRHARLAVRDRGGAQPPLPRPRAGPPRLRVLEQARARRLQRPLVRGDHARPDGRARDRRRAHRRQLDGRPDRDRARPDRARARPARSACCARPSRGSGAGLHPIVRLLRPEFGLLPARLPPLDWWPRSSGACSTTATRSTRRSAT